MILDWRVLGYDIDEPWEKRSNTKQDVFNKEADLRAEVFLEETFCPAIKEGLSKELRCEADIHMDEEEKQTVAPERYARLLLVCIDISYCFCIYYVYTK